MIRYQVRPDTAEALVTFTLQDVDPVHRTVAVVGDFNDWDPTAHVMDADGADRLRTATMSVPVGHRYAFRYLTDDGTWLDDDDPHDRHDNGMGGQNCVLDLCAEGDGSDAPVPGLDEPTASMAPGDGVPPG